MTDTPVQQTVVRDITQVRQEAETETGLQTVGEGAWSRSPLDSLEILDGKSVGAPGGWLKPVRTSEQGRALVQKRIDKVAAAVRAEVAEFGEGKLVQGVRKMTRAQINLAASGKAGSTSAFNAVLRHGELSQPRQTKQVGEGASVSVSVSLGGQAAAGLLGLLGKLGNTASGDKD